MFDIKDIYLSGPIIDHHNALSTMGYTGSILSDLIRKIPAISQQKGPVK